MFWTFLFAAAALPSVSALPMGSGNGLAAPSPRDDDYLGDGGEFPKAAVIGIAVPIVVVGLLLTIFRTAVFTTINKGYIRTGDNGSALPGYQREKFVPSPSITPQMTTVHPVPWSPLPREPPPAYTPTYSPKFNNTASEWPRPAAR